MTGATRPEQAIARFPVSLGLPDASPSLVADAAEAVRQEYRNSIRWKRLRCRRVAPVTGEPGETVFVIEVGHSIQFDWTWEGAVAFRPADISGFRGDADITDDFLVNDEEEANTSVWASEVVEVDETTGRIFVSVPDPSHPPRTGTFFVRPFEFLAFLNAIYSEADSGGLRPRFRHPGHPDEGLQGRRRSPRQGAFPLAVQGPVEGHCPVLRNREDGELVRLDDSQPAGGRGRPGDP